jgi:transcriptional regulator with XRE-family HTH domain
VVAGTWRGWPGRAYCWARTGSAPVPVAGADRLCGGPEMVTEQPELSFAGLLRRLRAGAKLTQEELAAAAGVSPRSVSNLERGINRTAHKDTAVLLAGALGLTCACRKPHPGHATRRYSLIRQAVWVCLRTWYRSRSTGSGRGFSGAAEFSDR